MLEASQLFVLDKSGQLWTILNTSGQVVIYMFKYLKLEKSRKMYLIVKYYD